MGLLVYQSSTSVDGFAADARGNFDFTTPDEEVHRHVNAGEETIGSYLLGRRMYGIMRYWDDPSLLNEGPEYTRDYAGIWRRLDKVVYSSDAGLATGPDTRLEQVFDPENVAARKARSEKNLGIGGATLAASALQAGLVDEIRQYIYPVLVGSGLPWLPPALELELELLDTRRFAGGVLFLSYAVR